MPREVCSLSFCLSLLPSETETSIIATPLRMRENYFRQYLISITACAMEVQHNTENWFTILARDDIG